MPIRTSAQTEQLDEAFARAQAKFEAAAKASSNPAYRSKYADISSIIDATLAHLNAEGISVRQHPGLEHKQIGADSWEAYVTVTTRLSYKGQWEESDLSLPAIQRDRFDPQSCGSALTYASRYALQGIFVVRREDDDANAASGVGSKEAAQAVAQRKIAESKKTPTSTKIDTLFYTLPENHNGNRVEFINLPQYIQSNLDRENELRFAFSAVGAKKNKDEVVWVAADKLEALLQTLAGELGITVHQLKPGANP